MGRDCQESCVTGQTGVDAPRRFACQEKPITVFFQIRFLISCWQEMIREALFFKDGLIDQLKKCLAEPAEAAEIALGEFESGTWGRKYPAITASWRRHRAHVIPFLAFPHDVRRIIYTTNAIESLNSTVRRAVRTRGQRRTARRCLLGEKRWDCMKKWRTPPSFTRA